MEFISEYTDTFGGEPNYSWCRRAAFTVKPKGKLGTVSDLAVMRAAKKAMGLNGMKGKRETRGETLVFRPYGSCSILFVDYVGGWAMKLAKLNGKWFAIKGNRVFMSRNIDEIVNFLRG